MPTREVIVVTGSSGFIGAPLTRALAADRNVIRRIWERRPTSYLVPASPATATPYLVEPPRRGGR